MRGRWGAGCSGDRWGGEAAAMAHFGFCPPYGGLDFGLGAETANPPTRPHAHTPIHLLFLAISVAAYSADEKTVEIAGVVSDGAKPIAGATVRLRTTSIVTTSDDQGRFTLGVPDKTWPVRVTASKDGYYIRGADAQKGAKDVKIVIEPYPATDAANFQWTGFLPNPDVKDSCGNCHSNIMNPWLKAGHASSHRNPVFKSFYLGTDAHGKPGVGQGYRLDFPNTVGACAACHVPAAALDAPWATDPSKVKDTDTAGIHCHFCHLVVDVDLKDLGRRPGVLAMKFRRPPPPKRLFLGPFDDMDRGAGGYVPLYTQSAYCAPCHEAEYWG
ncbi:MAG: carboxypeptidase regulatory-like domain-containing protein, partial [Planctomycetes bacterium]|nr:carboxypeptidase regulatory-like domain-containing protein [Planctomycetota bacterium]